MELTNKVEFIIIGFTFIKKFKLLGKQSNKRKML